MGVKKKYIEKRVPVNFKTSPSNRERFNKIVTQSLLTTATFVMNSMIVDFLEKWETREGKIELYNKYFKNEKYD